MLRSRADAARGAAAAALILLAWLGLPCSAAAQGDRFLRGVIALRADLEGVYGDEGSAIASRLEELGNALTAWDRDIRDAEQAAAAQEAAGPRAAAALIRLGSLYLQRGRFQDALTRFDAAARSAAPTATLHVLRALAFDAMSRGDEAGQAFREAWTLDPADPANAYLALRRSRLDESDSARARSMLLETARSVTSGARARATEPFFQITPFAAQGGTPAFPLASYAEAFALVGRGRHEEALARFRDVTARDPLLTDPALQNEHVKRGLAALRQRDMTSALAALEKGAAASPMSAEVHRILGTVLAIAGRTTESGAQFEAALRLRKDDERSWLALARARIEAGPPSDAQKTLEQAIAAVPASGGLRWMLAELLRRQERNWDALQRYEEASRLEPVAGRATLHQWVATLLSLRQDLDGAVSAVEGRVAVNPNESAAHRDLASLYAKQGRQDVALAELAIAAWLDPDDAFTFVALGHVHIAQARNRDALDALDRAVRLAPGLPDARYALAQALIREGRRQEAQVHLAEFQRLGTDARAHAKQEDEIAALRSDAMRLSSQKQPVAAVEAWKKVIALEPNTAQHYLDLADTLVRAGQLMESVEYYAKAADLDGVAEVHLKLAGVLSRLGRTRESALARQTYERLRLEDFARQRQRP